MPEYHYSLDRSDRIRSVTPEWVAFAVENGGPGLTESGVLGHRLWDFITDHQTRYLYELVLAKVRLDGRPITLPWVSHGICPAWHRSLEKSMSA